MENVNLKNQNDNSKLKIIKRMKNFTFYNVIFHFDFCFLIYFKSVPSPSAIKRSLTSSSETMRPSFMFKIRLA